MSIRKFFDKISAGYVAGACCGVVVGFSRQPPGVGWYLVGLVLLYVAFEGVLIWHERERIALEQRRLQAEAAGGEAVQTSLEIIKVATHALRLLNDPTWTTRSGSRSEHERRLRRSAKASLGLADLVLRGTLPPAEAVAVMNAHSDLGLTLGEVGA